MVHHVSFEPIETYLHKNVYPSDIMRDKGQKANFRKAFKSFSMLHGQLMYNNTSLVISSTERQHSIISNVHKGLAHEPRARAMASHCGRDSTIQKISNRFLWHNIKDDVEEFIMKCNQCELHSIIIKTKVMQQIGINICNLPEVDSFKHLVICMDYFSKWSEAKPTKDKSAFTVAQFLNQMGIPNDRIGPPKTH